MAHRITGANVFSFTSIVLDSTLAKRAYVLIINAFIHKRTITVTVVKVEQRRTMDGVIVHLSAIGNSEISILVVFRLAIPRCYLNNVDGKNGKRLENVVAPDHNDTVVCCDSHSA